MAVLRSVRALVVVAGILAACGACARAGSLRAAPRYEVYAVRYGTLERFPVAALVAGADPARRADIALMVWLARQPGGRNVLVDAGFYRDKFLRRWQPASYERPSAALARLGLRPEDVSDIIVSHVHWDHLDGADLFPNARLWIQRAEYEHYVDSAGRPRAAAIDSADAAMLAGLARAGRVELVAGDSVEILPGITVYTGGRHTYASQYTTVRTASGLVVLASDNAYLYENLERQRPITQTLDSLANLRAQERMHRLASRPALIVPGHDPAVFVRFPKPGAGVARIDGQPAAPDTPAAQQANEAIALLRLGRADAVWLLLRHTPDPSVRTELIHQLGRSGVDPDVILRRLDVEQDVSARRALILSLGHFTEEQLPLNTRRPLVAKLLEWYRHDPDPGVHAAIDWLLRHGRQGERPRALDWQQIDTLAAIDRDLAGRPVGERSWYVTREAQTMTVVRGPVEFRMGSPVDEAGRMPASDSPAETIHLVRIPRSFAISSKEVTIGQFRRFLDANPEVKRRHVYPGNPGRMAQVLASFSPDEDGPQIAVTWYEAAAYCNWLSKQEGIPESQWVYPLDALGIKSGMLLPKSYLQRTGYRLPTEAEWEYAARAGSTTARFFGASDAYLKEYAWYAANPPKKKGDPVDPNDPQRTWPVGQLEPNDLGLFDVYGNVWEWTQNRMHRSADKIRDDAEDAALVVTDSTARPRRGGGFPYEAAAMRSAGRGTVNAFPMTRRDNVGFRIARTLAP